MLEQFERTQKDFLSGSGPQTMFSDIDAEAEYVNLPSGGRFYSGKYKNIDKLLLRKLNWEGEYILTTPSYHNNDTIFDELLKKCIIDKDFPVLELVEVDKQTLLLWLKIGAYGTEHKTAINCPECKEKVSIIWNFEELTSPDYDLVVEKELKTKGEYKVILPKGKFICSLFPHTKAKELVLNDFISNLTQSTNEEMIITRRLLNSVISVVDGDKTYSGIKEVYSWLKTKRLSMQDSRFLQNEIKKIDIKIDTTKQSICPNCSNSQSVEVMFNNTFFGLGSEYREYLDESINYLVFWGRLDYQSALRMPTKKRIDWVKKTKKNLEILFPKSKK